MKRSARELILMVAGVFLIAAPFIFALLRARQTGTDWRYLWVAIAAFVGSSVVIATTRAKSKSSAVTVGATALAFIAATLAAVLGAKFLANTQSVAVWIVAAAFAFCTTAGTVLYLISGPRAD